MFSICYNSRVKYEETGQHPERITKIKPFKNKYIGERTNASLKKKKQDWKKFKENNVTTALTVLYAKKKKYILLHIRHKSNREKQVMLLIISNGEKWQYLASKKLSAL